jgi:4-coumarate--CoA ligase
MLSSGAAPLTKDLVDAVYARLKLPIKQAYGLSETSPSCHNQSWDDWNKTVGSVGKLLSSMEAKYMSTPDAASSTASEPVELPVGEAGELWLRGPNIFLGYHNNPVATENALTEDGWFKTGDVGFQDKDGNFYITDRVKELINYTGSQAAPAELEGLLISHEKIGDVAVVGVESEALGTEVPRAYVVPSAKYGGPEAAKKFGAKEEKEIQDWLAERLANHKKLRGGVSFVEEVPKSVSGKILRRVLKDRARQEMQKESSRVGKAKL